MTFVEKEPAERHAIISWEQVSIFLVILQRGWSEYSSPWRVSYAMAAL